ncbi:MULTISPECIES: hypothetical protein [Calothrix]|uniref:Uncharacterized protein n=3 Tax=Calothrix TaxID=1186 RepID=A0ABR8AD30_9CYAN|nr:hypothetical protein [Calothrix parietina]MBD2197916.1 hypothetical protein [Calothrix parietina FACHB-288]MBD2226799.1 hypothetical protein [Calothrix anomala FACHB-343]
MQTINNQHQFTSAYYQNENYSYQSWTIQPRFSATWHNSKSLTPDVETGLINDYMNKLIKFSNSNHKLSQKFKCNLNYPHGLSSWNLQNLAAGCLSQIQQGFLQQLIDFINLIYQRYKNNFDNTEAVLQRFFNYIGEILLTGRRLSRNE